MANETMTLISTITVGAGGTTSLDFANIPQNFTDLYLVFSGRIALATATSGWTIYIGGFPTASRNLYGNGSTTASNNSGITELTIPGSSATANTFGNASVYMTNYSGSTAKSMSYDSVSENNATSAGQTITASYFSSTSPITSLSVYALGQTIVQYSTASLYGILKGSGGASVS